MSGTKLVVCRLAAIAAASALLAGCGGGDIASARARFRRLANVTVRTPLVDDDGWPMPADPAPGHLAAAGDATWIGNAMSAVTPGLREMGSSQSSPTRATYLRVLAWAFTLFNSVRVAAYLPTMWAICQSGDSSQHSLWTWCTWLGANATMAAWLYETHGRRIDRVVMVNIGQRSDVRAIVVLILAQRRGTRRTSAGRDRSAACSGSACALGAPCTQRFRSRSTATGDGLGEALAQAQRQRVELAADAPDVWSRAAAMRTAVVESAASEAQIVASASPP